MNAKHQPVLLLTIALVCLTIPEPNAEAHHIRLRGGVTPSLADPVAGAVISQSDPACNGLFGSTINFDWSIPNPIGHKTFTLVLQHVGSPVPASLQQGLTTPSAVFNDCGSVVIDSNLSNWYWQVTVFNRAGKQIGQSERRPLSFAPCRLQSGQPC
jgi:hypothetical protein